MNADLLNSVISSAGTMLFPCLFCVFSFKIMMDYIREKDSQHIKEIDKLSDVIHQNTETLIALKSYLESAGKKEKQDE